MQIRVTACAVPAAVASGASELFPNRQAVVAASNCAAAFLEEGN